MSPEAVIQELLSKVGVQVNGKELAPVSVNSLRLGPHSSMQSKRSLTPLARAIAHLK
jgi:hypothetical protein